MGFGVRFWFRTGSALESLSLSALERGSLSSLLVENHFAPKSSYITPILLPCYSHVTCTLSLCYTHVTAVVLRCYPDVTSILPLMLHRILPSTLVSSFTSEFSYNFTSTFHLVITGCAINFSF